MRNTNSEGTYGSSAADTDVTYDMYANDPAMIVERELDGEAEPAEDSAVDLTGHDLGQDDPMLDAMRNHAHPNRP